LGELEPSNYGAPGEIRTPGLLVRSQALYPTELRAQKDKITTQRLDNRIEAARSRGDRTPRLDGPDIASPSYGRTLGRVRGANITTSNADDHSIAGYRADLGMELDLTPNDSPFLEL
jgi:hypothetical protein